jgi:hypothetical protein
MHWFNLTATWKILIALHDVVTENKEVCQYSINESPEGSPRIKIGTEYAGLSFCDAA